MKKQSEKLVCPFCKKPLKLTCINVIPEGETIETYSSIININALSGVCAFCYNQLTFLASTNKVKRPVLKNNG